MKSLLTIFVIFIFIFCSGFDKIPDPDCGCLKDMAEEYRILEQPYLWGDWDCSKFVEQILTDCGIQVERCTSKDYAYGKCGFDSLLIPMNLRTSCDFAFWTWPNSNRKFGHIGMFEHKTSVYHNSSGAGKIIKSKVEGNSYYRKHLKRIRRLELND